MKNLMKLAFAALAMIVMVSCGTPSVEDVVKKINNGDELTEKDYSVMIEEAEKYSNEIIPQTQKLFELGTKASAGDAAAEKEGRELGDKIDARNKEFQPIMTALSSATEEKMGKENYEKFTKLMEKNQKEAEKIMQQAYEAASKQMNAAQETATEAVEDAADAVKEAIK